MTSYNTGTTKTVTNSGTASGTVTIPAGVLSGDTILVAVMVFTTATGTITPTLTSAATTPVQPSSSPKSASGGGITIASGLWSIAAGASDPGATLTFGATGGTGGAYWVNAGLVSYTGSGGVDVSSGNAAYQSAWPGNQVSPAATTGVAGDWQVQLMLSGPPNGSNFTVPGTLTGRQSITSAANAGLLLNIADSNGSVGGSGTSIGNTTWTCGTSSATQGWQTEFTVGLAPSGAAAGTPSRSQPELRGAPAAVRGKLTGVAAPPPVTQPGVPAPFYPPHVPLRGGPSARPGRLAGAAAAPPAIHALSFNPSPPPQPGSKAWRARFRRRQAPWPQPGPPPPGAAPVTVIPPLLRGPAVAVKGRLTGLVAPPPVIPGPPAPFYPPHVLLRGPAAAVLARLTGFAVPTPRPPRASPFYPPHVLLRGPAAAVLARLTGARGRPGIPAPFTPPHVPSRGPGAAKAGQLAGLAAPPPVLHPAVASVFKLPGYPLHGPAAARKGGLAGVIAPPPVTQPSVPSPFYPPHLPLRGPVPAAPRTKTTGAVAPPPAPPPVTPPHWQGSTHMIAATATGNLIQGASHTGRGGPGTDLKGDYERSGD